MNKKCFNINAIIMSMLYILLILSACDSAKMKEYYSKNDNYVNAVGTVAHIEYNDQKTILYLGFSDLEPEFDDTAFKIVGDNLPIVQGNGFDDKIKIGDKVDFVTAPRYFGDGYVMPIVALSFNGEQLLEKEEGIANFQMWFDDNN